jgi:hypothetical protein
MSPTLAIIIGVGIIVLIGYRWARGITNMKEKYPEYDGKEYLNWDRKDDDWDNPTAHTEGDF